MRLSIKERRGLSVQVANVGKNIEINEIDLPLCRHILSLGHVTTFILNEDLINKNLGDLPYCRFLGLEERVNPQAEGAGFRGYVLRVSDKSISDLSLVDLKKQVQSLSHIDLEITSYKAARNALLKLRELKSFTLHLSPGSKLAPREFNKVLIDINTKEKYFPLSFSDKTYDLTHPEYDNWIELENFRPPIYQQNHRPSHYTVIIPHYENKFFVCNVLAHLNRVKSSEALEVIVVDDGSKVGTLEYIQYNARRNCPNMNFSLFSWPDVSRFSNGKKIFRAGASRNWGAHYASSESLLFLDSDMLVPENFLQVLESSLNKSDVTQFSRLHIPQMLSHEGVCYQDLGFEKLMIEEEAYWSQLFNAKDWMALPDHWKFTCTYALGIKKSLFESIGRIRRNYIQYGFEDTDLGYRLAQAGKVFRLEKTPLLHLTEKLENSNSWFYKLDKMRRLQPTARMFYYLNQNKCIYESLQSMID